MFLCYRYLEVNLCQLLFRIRCLHVSKVDAINRTGCKSERANAQTLFSRERLCIYKLGIIAGPAPLMAPSSYIAYPNYMELLIRTIAAKLIQTASDNTSWHWICVSVLNGFIDTIC